VELSRRGLERNVRLYPWYGAFTSAYFWLPTFFLFFNSKVPVEDVLRLEAIYYFSVVLLEVPSGYYSDRFGRRRTLILSSLFFIFSYGLFLLSDSFFALACAQAFLAAGIAFNSGTDTSFHYDSLLDLGEEESYAEREGRVAHLSFLASALSALLGGIFGVYDLRFPYLLSLLCAGSLFVMVVLFVEPSQKRRTELVFLPQIWACLSYLRVRKLFWLFTFSILMVVLNHVPYEFYQPYLRALGGNEWISTERVPAFSGFHSFLVMIIASIAAKRSIGAMEKWGLSKLLISCALLQISIICMMAFFLHPVVGILLLLRSVPRALMTAPLNAAISPLIKSEHRATYLSIQSLMGRLTFSASLFLAALTFSSTEISWAEMRHSLLLYGGCGVFALLIIASGFLYCHKMALRGE
jgi:predicted MFS family arabinose efflux permease